MGGALDDQPFSWRLAGDEVHISHGSRRVTVLRGIAAARFVSRIEALAAADAQQLMARVTGNFKRGNEQR